MKKNINDNLVVTQEDFDSLSSYRYDSRHSLRWECLFVLPEWLKVWWAEFNCDAQLNILSVKDQKAVIGLAPLQVSGARAALIGGTNVCDHLDFIATVSQQGVFFDALLDHLGQQGIKNLELGLLRPDSTVLSNLVKVAEKRGCEVFTSAEDISLELELPATWEDYLSMMKGKQRHEVKRKLRRLHEAGDINFRVIEDPGELAEPMVTFFKLFKMSSNEKAAFMTDQMVSFFQALASAMAASQMLKLYILELNGTPVASSMCFDFNDTLHLYNSGFDPRFRALSVGLMCKVLTIQDAVKRGMRKYDFLKGAETYKYRLGGREVPLYNCRIQL